MGFARTMSPRELREAYVELMTELDEYRLKEKYGNPHITSALPTSHCEAVTLLTRQKK
jgi:ribosomal protein L29